MKIRYFDHAATTPVGEEVLKEMMPYFNLEYGNASSMYGIGRSARRAIEQARQRVAKAIGAETKEIYFTSCGSESDNLALKGIVRASNKEKCHIITSKIEHPAILHTCQALEKDGCEVTYLSVDKEGKISLEKLENSIRPNTILISIMFANNEIGTIQQVKEIGEIAKKYGVLFHTDSVQAIGNVKINVKEMNIDMLSMSAHKFYGPKGVGALYVRNGVEFDRIQDGGHQERNKRAGTENVAGIVGIGKAIECIYEDFEDYNKKLKELREYYFTQVEKKIPNVKINGHRTDRLPGNANISIPGMDGGEMLLKLDQFGICASSGSACSTGSSSPSHVLLAIGLPTEMAQGTLRTTFGKANTKEDIDYLVECLETIVKR